MKTLEIKVLGLVQGVGYRPFIAELAEELKIKGQVKNAGGIVEIIASGEEEALDSFVQRILVMSPKGSRVDEVITQEQKQQDFETFLIVESNPGEEKLTFVPADLATCENCEKEMKDPKNRRYRYPFISCVSCGPRFSIIEDIPYDRDTITMNDFPMCSECEREYTEKKNLRRHAQTIACYDCGPKLSLITSMAEEEGFATVNRAISFLLDGKIGAIKDIGGFHFAFLATNEKAAKRLREFKNREKKPFAVMFESVEAVREYCEVNEKEEELLTSVVRPIVLLKKKKDFCKDVCGESDRIGAMLPCNPLQILLVEATGPLVMTSGNRGGEPIITEDGAMKELLNLGCPDFMLTHDRRILTPLEDSIIQVIMAPFFYKPATEEGKQKDRYIVQILRRGRGYVPEAIRIQHNLGKPCMAAGGDLKAVFALGKEDAVYLSSHFGDLQDYYALKKRSEAISHMERLLRVMPELSIGDLHPSYISAENCNLRVQHHHSHILSVMAEHNLGEEPILGVAFDGTGYGIDHSIWGGEFLLCEGYDFKRVGHLMSVPMAGSDEGAKDGELSLLAYMYHAQQMGKITEDTFDTIKNELSSRKQMEKEEKENRYAFFTTMLQKNLGIVKSSSMGRLFDAAAALLGIKSYNSYEGECAIALEIAAQGGRIHENNKVELNFPLQREDGIWVIDSVQLLVDMWKLIEKKEADLEAFALGFHMAIVKMTVELIIQLTKEYGTQKVALSGGTFFNRILMENIMYELAKENITVYTNEKVPCGDGGLSLGQMYYLALKEAKNREQ